MKKALMIFVLATAFAACTPVEYDNFSTITGTVVDYATGAPISTVLVTISPGGYAPCTTGDDGFFKFNEVEAMDRNYSVWVQKEGYDPNHKDIYAIAGETVNMTIIMKKQ